MKIIFLDIDGVLNQNDHGIREEKVAILNDLIKATDARIVVSSSWRIGQNMETMTHIMQSAGIRGEVIGMTPVHDWTTFKGRGHEIREWMERYAVNPDDVVILDDHDDMCRLFDRLVKTDGSVGLTVPKAREAAWLLGGDL